MKNLEQFFDIIVVGRRPRRLRSITGMRPLRAQYRHVHSQRRQHRPVPCNPNVGGSSKRPPRPRTGRPRRRNGQNIDKTFIQSKMLNQSKGPAVHSLRAQADKQAYSTEMRKTLENTENLTIRQGEVTELLVEDGHITGVKTFSGATYHAKAVVLCTGTYLKARCIYGDVSNYTGPNGLQAANYLTVL